MWRALSYATRRISKVQNTQTSGIHNFLQNGRSEGTCDDAGNYHAGSADDVRSQTEAIELLVLFSQRNWMHGSKMRTRNLKWRAPSIISISYSPGCPLYFSPASIASGKMFCLGGSGQVAKSVNAQGGL